MTHNFLGPILTAASVHLDTCIPNFVVQEYSKGDESASNRIFKTVLRREGGYIPVPEAPGLGVEEGKRPSPQKRALLDKGDMVAVVQKGAGGREAPQPAPKDDYLLTIGMAGIRLPAHSFATISTFSLLFRPIRS